MLIEVIVTKNFFFLRGTDDVCFEVQKWTTTRQDAKAHLKVPSYASTTAVSSEALPQ